MATIGIDLGRTFSCAAAFIRGKIEIIPNGVGNDTTPSVVAFKQGDGIIVGEKAVSEGIYEPKNTIFDIKRLIGKKFRDPKIQEYLKTCPYEIADENGKVAVVVNGWSYSPNFLSTQILRYLKEQAETFLNAEVKKAVVAVPAYFTEEQKSIMRDACKGAGLEVLQLIPEPTAAAISYYYQMRSREHTTFKGERTCLIFDLGGSTLDISFVTYKDKPIKVVKVGGDQNLGGEDFDNAMVEYCVEEFKKKHGIDLRRPIFFSLTTVKPEKVARNLRRLKMECQKQKCFLSSRTRVVVRLDAIHGELDLVVPITKKIFEELNESKLQRCLTIVKQTMEECGLRKEEIHDIVLVGGSTRIPRVQQLLTEYFGKKLTQNMNAKEAVAFGAAMQANFLVNADSTETATFKDKFQLEPNFAIERENLVKGMKELRSELTQIKNSHHREAEKLREDLSIEREEGLRLASSVMDLEGKREMMLNRVGKEISIKHIPSGLLSFHSTHKYSLAVVVKNSTSAHFLHPSQYYVLDETREYFPMPLEIPPFSEHGFGFTCSRALGGLFSFQIDETRFAAYYEVWVGLNSLGLAFLPPIHPAHANLCFEMKGGADWSKSPEKCKVLVEYDEEDEDDGKKEKTDARLEFGRICAEARMTIGLKSVLNIEIKTIGK